MTPKKTRALPIVLAALGTVLLLCFGTAVAGAIGSDDNAAAPPQSSRRTSTAAAASTAAAVSTTAPAASGETASPSPTAVVEKRTVTETQAIPYATKTVTDSSLAKGTTRVRTRGVPGVKTVTYEVTLVNGVQTAKTLVRSEVTKAPVTQVVAVGTKVTQQCDPNYTGACVPIASDVDCAGGGGNGPAYVQGPVRVVGTDIYDLDRDGDGIGCEN
ncbi:MAG TPA: G5 domain-containing protein [Micromonosporaceae bacterium]